MPRPAKTFRRHKINAALAYKRGDREEAYKLWDKAAAGRREHVAKKRAKKNAAESESTE